MYFQNECRLTAVAVDPEMKFLKAFRISSFSLVVLKSFEDDPSLFFTPSIRNPSVAVDEMVSRQTMYLCKLNVEEVSISMTGCISTDIN